MPFSCLAVPLIKDYYKDAPASLDAGAGWRTNLLTI